VAVVTNFKDRITDLAGVQITADDNAIKQWVLDGCYDIINRLKGMANPLEFASKSGAITTSVVVELDTIREFIGVERNNIECNMVTSNKRHLYASGDSIYEVTADDPIYYINNGQVIVAPTPTSSQAAYYTYIPEYSITDFDTSTSSIDGFPKKYYEHLILYASFIALGKQLLNLIQDTADSSLSMDVISKMMNADKPDSGGDVWDWLADEDSEMAQATMGAIQSASSITKQKYDWYAERMNDIRTLYLSKFPQPASPKGDR
jgi:hypothetical protein